MPLMRPTHAPHPRTPASPPPPPQCIDQGYAFYWGTSEWSAEQIEEAWRIAERLDLIGPGEAPSKACCLGLASPLLGMSWAE